MTMTSSKPELHHNLDNLIDTTLDRSVRGNATAHDWREIAKIDENRARRELTRFLQRSQPVVAFESNPYDKGARGVGTITGFVGGILLMAVMWQFGVPWLQDAWADIDYGPGFATALTYVSTIFLPLGAWIGSRWDKRHANPIPSQPQPGPIDPNATFDDLLQRFCQTQSRSRTRVY